jgi:superfamily I DNA/RNA helicase
MASAGQVTWAGICKIAKDGLEAGKIESPYDAVIVDEVQDLQVQEILFLNALAKDNPGELMLLGDAGQRIYPGGFSLKKLGINTVGRSHILRINYRTTEQIRKFSDAILPDSSEDFNEGAEKRNSVSLLNGPTPELCAFDGADTQVQFVVEQIRSLAAEKIAPHEIAIFARTSNHLKPYESALQAAGISTVPLDSDDTDESIDGVNLGTMHRAKGLEFKVVFVVDASDTVIPNQFVMGKMRDQGDYDDAFQRERQLLYVAMTRARDELFITYVGKPSQFLAKHQSQ